MNKRIVLSLLLASVLLAACGSAEVIVGQEPGIDTTDVPVSLDNPTTADEPDPVDGAVLVVRESGGCFMAGPNCRTISIMGDGTVLIAWDESESINESTLIDPALVTSWLEIADATDFNALVNRLPEGECKGCFDGIDLVFELQHHDIVLDSQVVGFVASEPFFAATNSLIDSVPFTLGEPALSSDPTSWNNPIEPALDIDGIPVAITAELLVVEFPGRALGGGILDAGAGFLGTDGEYAYLAVGGTRGCASYQHMALVPTTDSGVYELFHDTDNTCEAAGGTGYRTPLADLLPAADGSITIVNSNDTTSSLAADGTITSSGR